MIRDAEYLVSQCSRRQDAYLARTTASSRKIGGQFFTPASVARFMAARFRSIPREFHLLDPGAGAGMLAAAVCERILRLRGRRRASVTLIENDSRILGDLEATMQACARALRSAGHELEYIIRDEDYVLSGARALNGQQELFSDRAPGQFDAVIANPPYFKINKNSTHARAAADIVHGQPNIYAIFLALAASSLRPGGELVAITPRSFCNGLYFRGFRRWFLQRMSLLHVHLFESRTETFREASVLQESVITHSRCCPTQTAQVAVTHSRGRELRGPLESHKYSANDILDRSREDTTIWIPASAEDARLLALVKSWSHRFADIGLSISTGPVVMFRAKPYLRDEMRVDCVPLIAAHNIHPFQVEWPVRKKKWPVAFSATEGSARHLSPARNYVLLKRFSSKEQRRRLTAGCFFPDRSFQQVALENHVNYVRHCERDLTRNEVYGIAAVFNSRLFDRYFRILSGNTQVNATEIRAMRFPDLRSVARIGRVLRSNETLDPQEAEAVVLDELGVNGSVRGYLLEEAS